MKPDSPFAENRRAFPGGTTFIGPHEMGRWQQRERAWALDQLVGRNDFPVIPVLLQGCEPPLGFMKQLMWIDLRDNPTDPTQLDALAAAIQGETNNREGQPEPRAMICPYRGLLAFREEDADFFFGRQKYRRSCEAGWAAFYRGRYRRFWQWKVMIVRAGLVPHLRKRDAGPVWDILTMFPKETPLHSLADLFLPLVEPGSRCSACHRMFTEVHGTNLSHLAPQPDNPLLFQAVGQFI